ncbi:hypothetical protein [Desulfocicer niacini]
MEKLFLFRLYWAEAKIQMKRSNYLFGVFHAHDERKLFGCVLMRRIFLFLEVKAPHSLIYIDAPNELCLKRIEQRRKEQPERSATDTVEMFE